MSAVCLISKSCLRSLLNFKTSVCVVCLKPKLKFKNLQVLQTGCVYQDPTNKVALLKCKFIEQESKVLINVAKI